MMQTVVQCQFKQTIKTEYLTVDNVELIIL